MSATSTFQRIARVVFIPLLVLMVGAGGAFILFKAKPKSHSLILRMSLYGR